MSKKRSLVNQAIDDLMSYIRSENWDEKQKLPKEADLCELLGVGRSTVREAVKILSFSGVLTVKQGSGTYINVVTPPQTQVTYKQLKIARMMLEKTAVQACATQTFTANELLVLKEALHKRNTCLTNGQYTDFVTADLLFHQKIIELTKNPLLIRWYDEIFNDLQQALSTYVLETNDFSDNTDLHEQLLHAIIMHDVKAAVALIDANIGEY